MTKINVEKPVMYPSYAAVWYVKGGSNIQGAFKDPITSEVAKELLGWEEEEEGGSKFGSNYLLIDRFGKKIRCTNNITNRPLYLSNMEACVQEVLRGRWVINGETIIIGQTGKVLNGQHQLCGVILAEQDRLKDRKMWEHLTEPLYIEKLVVFGIEETDVVINTMDTCKPRSLADVIYRSPYFQKSTQTDRQLASRILDHAIKQLWIRTGVYLPENGFSLRRTHAEAIDLVERHKKLLKCVAHIMKCNKREKVEGDENDTSGVISTYLPLGYAATALYLMATSGSDPEKYMGKEEPNEKGLDWSKWDIACQFWEDFKTDAFDPLRKAIAGLQDEESGVAGRLTEKDYLVIKAWELYLENKKMTSRNLVIKYNDPDANGRITLKDIPELGGIDLGLVKIKPPKAKESEPPPHVQNGIEKRKEKVKNGEPLEEIEETTVIALPLDRLRKENPTVDILMTLSAKGKREVWGSEATKVGEVVDKLPKMHPKGMLHLAFSGEELDTVVKMLNKSGITVGFVNQDMEDDSYYLEVFLARKGK